MFPWSMVDDLLKMWETFTLTEDEDMELDIPRGEFQYLVSWGRACIVGKLIVDQMVRKEALRASFIRWWKPSGNLSFKVLGENLFLIDFVELGDNWTNSEYWQGERGYLKETCFLLKILMELFSHQDSLLLRLPSGYAW